MRTSLKYTLLLLSSLACVVSCSDEPDSTPNTPENPVDMATDAGDVADMSPEIVTDMPADASNPPDMPADMLADTPSDMADMADMAEEDMAQLPCIRPSLGAMTSEGQRSDGWRWTKAGLVFPSLSDDFDAGDGDFSPSIIPEGDGYRIYFARRRNRAFELWTSTSSDGESWTDAVKVMGLEGENYPAALRQEDGSVRLWFGSGSFDVATSQDGVNFTDQERRILTPTEVGSFAQVSMIYPEVRRSRAGDGYRMWFTGFDGQQLRIGTAFSANGERWTPEPDPVLSRREGTTYDSNGVGQPEVHEIGGKLYMWHGGYDTSNTDPGPWRIALASSDDDGTTWTREGVSIPLAEDGFDMWSTRDAAVIKKSDGSGWLMVYVGMKDDSKYRLLSATSNACLTTP